MRVPIFSKDLESGRGVLRLARCLQRDWPSKQPIKLSAAQNLMSRCLGYVDFHDVRMSADCADFVFPCLEDVQAQSFAIIKAELTEVYRPVEISDKDIFARISKLPFMHLHAFCMLSGELCVKLSKEELQISRIATLYYTTSGLNSALDEIDVQSVYERVRSAIGHNPTEMTMSYIKSPIDHCRRHNDPEAPVCPTECYNCGPATL